MEIHNYALSKQATAKSAVYLATANYSTVFVMQLGLEIRCMQT